MRISGVEGWSYAGEAGQLSGDNLSATIELAAGESREQSFQLTRESAASKTVAAIAHLTEADSEFVEMDLSIRDEIRRYRELSAEIDTLRKEESELAAQLAEILKEQARLSQQLVTTTPESELGRAWSANLLAGEIEVTGLRESIAKKSDQRRELELTRAPLEK